MKKVLLVLLIVIFTFGICSCSNTGPDAVNGNDITGQTIAGAPDMGVLDSGTSSGDNTSTDQETSDNSSSGDESDNEIIASADYYCYDRFSGESVPGSYIRVHSSNSSQVVFDYVTSAGSFTYLTAYIDGNGFAYLDLSDTLGINITFYSSEIYVDELEGMGAMAYVFR